MKKIYLLNLFLVLFLFFSSSGYSKTYKYSPKTKEELKALVDNESINLGDIDTSKITDMSELFQYSKRDNFSGIENWDVSNVEDMKDMFSGAKSFNQDIGNWDVSRVKYMGFMFTEAESFNQDINKWDISNVVHTIGMLSGSQLENNPPAWYREF